MNKKIIISIAFAVLLVFMFPTTVYANSSWHWVSSTRPLDLLPAVIIVTLIIEIVIVNYIAKVRDLKRVVPVVLIANLVSFLVPYVWTGFDPENAYSVFISGEGLFYTINYSAEHMPVFTVSAAFLLLTLVIETPIVYLFFRKRAPSRINLLIVIIVANLLTTAINGRENYRRIHQNSQNTKRLYANGSCGNIKYQ